MAHLLTVHRLKSKAMQRKNNVPLLLEFQVNEETAPYLVSSSTGVMWINEPHPNNIVKAAVRAAAPGQFFAEVIDAVVSMGREMQWGNVHTLTVEGLRAAVAHIEFYELGPVELLTPRAHLPEADPDPDPDEDEDSGEPLSSAQRVDPVDLMPPELRPLIEDLGLPFRPSSWVPDNTIVVVPKDRAYVGLLSRVTTQKIAAVVHNAARGIAVVQGSPVELAR